MATRYADVREEIRDGDVVLFRGGGVIGRLYTYTHAEVCRWMRDENGVPVSLMVAGFREFQGARMVSLSSQVSRYPGRIDVYRPRCDHRTAWWASEMMVRQSGKRYGWFAILLALLWHCTLLRFVTGWNPGPAEASEAPNQWSSPKICSSAVVWAFRRWMGKKRQSEWPCRHLPTWRVYPQHIADDVASFRLVYRGLTHRDV